MMRNRDETEPGRERGTGTDDANAESGLRFALRVLRRR